MNAKKKIGIDLDSTLNNLEEIWMDRYNKDYPNKKIKLKDWVSWDVHTLVDPKCGQKIYEYLHEPKFFYNLDIKPKAKEVVEFLSENYELYIVTAYTSDTCKDKTDWIKKQKLKINDKNIIFINNKSLLNLDYLIDDGPHNFTNFGGMGIVFDMPYNKHLKDNSNIKRVKTWADIKKFFEIELTTTRIVENLSKEINKIVKEC